MNILHASQLNKVQLNYFQELTNENKVVYLFGLFDALIQQNVDINMTSFFKTFEEIEHINTDELDLENEIHVDVMIDNDNILVESDNLKALRMTVRKFFESGYILIRDKEAEKMFKADKVTKYMRIHNCKLYI
jgi:hypothetical protein